MDVRGRAQQRRSEEKKQREEVTINGEKGLPARHGEILVNMRRIKNGEKLEERSRILSHWGFHGNLPTSAFLTALQTERQQLVYTEIASRQ